LKFIRANLDNFWNGLLYIICIIQGTENCRTISLCRASVLYWLYSFLGCVLNIVHLKEFAACNWRIFDFEHVIPLDRLLFSFLRNKYNSHTFCILWFTEHMLQRALCYFSKLIISIILVMVASSKACEIKSRN
jgi:hypothetical protein